MPKSTDVQTGRSLNQTTDLSMAEKPPPSLEPSDPALQVLYFLLGFVTVIYLKLLLIPDIKVKSKRRMMVT